MFDKGFVLFLYADGAPVGETVAELDVGEPGALHHFMDLRTRETLLQTSSETVESIRPHCIKTVHAVNRERKRLDIETEFFEQPGYPAKRQVNE
jgi:hypothetical protein